MKYDKFFQLAKEAGIQEAELYVNEKHSLECSLFHGEIDNYSDNKGFSILARGIINGKSGGASCDVWSNEKAQYLVDQIVANAGVIENDDPVFIFEGSAKYHKVNTYNKAFELVTIDEKIAKAKELEAALKKYSEKIAEVAMTGYEETTESFTLFNTKGLKLTQKLNYFLYYAQVVAKEGEQTKSNFNMYLGNDFAKFDVNALANKIGKGAVDQLGGEACETKTYKAVLSPGVVNSLLKFYVSHVSSEEVQKHTSLFIGKIGQKIASSKLTIEDRPLVKSVFARWFDDEGVATYNKPIIKNGVLQGFLYNLTTAAKEGVQTTGNGYLAGGKTGVSSSYAYVKPGKKTQEQLFADVKDGVYITEVSGLHAGLNPQSGNFSLQSTGFLIKDGKKDRGLDIITVSGNLLEVFNNIVAVGCDGEEFANGSYCPSIQIKKLAVSGK